MNLQALSHHYLSIMSNPSFSSLYGGCGGVEGITSHDLVYDHTEEQFMDSEPCDTMRVCIICEYTKKVGEPKDGAMFTCNKCFNARKRTFASIRYLGELRYNEDQFDEGRTLRDDIMVIESFGYIDY